LADAAIGGQQVVLRLRIRRFFCHHPACPARTFAEQIPGLTTPYARRSPLARRMLEQVALALAGRAGARLAGMLGLPVGRSTLLRLLRALPDPAPSTVAVLGVDDFAPRRGHVYGTVLVDLDNHRPVELLADREADTFADWLREHPGTQVVCRDRNGAYADGAHKGAPQARQVANRCTCGTTSLRTSKRPRPAIAPARASPNPPACRRRTPTPESTLPRSPPGSLRIPSWSGAPGNGMRPCRHCAPTARASSRSCENWAWPRRPCAASTALPVSRSYWLNPARDGPASSTRSSPTCTSAGTRAYQGHALFKELRAPGYQGSAGIVRNYLRPFRQLGTTPPPAPAPPKVRHVTSWILRHPDSLKADEQLKLKGYWSAARTRTPSQAMSRRSPRS
jgi:hypothetical protein